MRGRVIAAVVALGVMACGGSEDPPEDSPPQEAFVPTGNSSVTCSDDCNGQLASAPNGLCSEYDEAYVGGAVTCSEACEVVETQCVTESEATALEYDPCEGASISPLNRGTCAEGMECLPWTSQNSGFCMTACTTPGDDETCGDGTCVALAVGEYCFNADAQRDEPCFENQNMCAEDQGTCLPTSFDGWSGAFTDYRCKSTCDGAELDEQSTCLEEEICKQNPVGFVEMEGEETCASDDDCSDDFDCMSVGGGERCAKYLGWCSVESSLCTDLSEQGLDECETQEETTCDVGARNGSRTCAVSGRSEGMGDLVEDAEMYCTDRGDGDGVGVCLGVCESDDGDLNCGEGFTCATPTEEQEYYYDAQYDDFGAVIECREDARCGSEFKCVEFSSGSYCARAMKLCLDSRYVDENGKAYNAPLSE